MSQFIDEAEVLLQSGTGGSGSVSFHREKHVPRGGPNGSDGGKGGDIILIANRHRRTLYDFRLTRKYTAQPGAHAVLNKRGKDGRYIELEVPVGTIVTDLDTGEQLADLNIHGMKYRVCKGGRGGFGNLHYVSSIRQVPNFAEKGEPGETRRVKLEMKLLADIGLVGLPNAGKSTLLSQISAAKPKIADYPFTTIIPNLGVVQVVDQTFVVADLPGLIEGAHEGVGLGIQFLKHVERTKALVHVIDLLPVDESDPMANYHLIEKELSEYAVDLTERPRLLALNKTDLIPSDMLEEVIEPFKALGFPVFPISAATGQGIQPLVFAMLELIEAAEAAPVAVVTLNLENKKDEDEIYVVHLEEENAYEVISAKVKRMVLMTNLENRDAVRYLHRRLARTGVVEKLKAAGAQEGDTVYVGEAVFSFTEQS
jgi:GTPase